MRAAHCRRFACSCGTCITRVLDGEPGHRDSYFTAAERAARRARAFADATRLTLAAALAEGDELCVCDLAWVVERAENLVSHHLRLLRSDGLVTSRRDGKLVMYSLTSAGRELLAHTLAEEAPA